MSAETHEFQAEVQKLLDLMIHSLYSNKDVFLRELVSNASDALDRRRFQGLTDASLLPEGEFGIELRADADARSLTIVDNGLGMSRDDVRNAKEMLPSLPPFLAAWEKGEIGLECNWC